MPSGIILASGSQGATQEAIEAVLTKNGYEAEKPAASEVVIEEPKRDDFKSDEEFEAAQETFEAAEEAREDAEEQEREKTEREKQQQAKPLSRRQKAIAKATAQTREELRKANERIAALENKDGKDGKKPAVQTETVKEPEKPQREKFATDAEFDEAMFDYRYQLRRAKEQAEASRNSLQAQREEHWGNYKSNVKEFAVEHDDFDQVVNDKILISDAVYEAIVRTESPAVAYHLGKNPEIAERLNSLDPVAAIAEIGRLAERLNKTAPDPDRAAAAAAKTKTKSKALPEPVKPLSASATSSTLTSKEAAKNRDFKAFKAAQRRGA